MRHAIAVWLMLPALAFGAAPDKPKPRPNLPGVDWNAKTIRATGRGAPALNAPSIAAARIGAERVAEMDALRSILAVLKGIQITSEKTVGDSMASSDEVKSKLEGEARGFKRVDTRYFSDGGVEIDVEMGIGDLLAELMPEAKEGPRAAALPLKGEAANTGLVVDAGGLKVKPALAPRILDEGGVEVYSAAVVAPDAMKKNGIAGYLKSVDEARRSSRTGEKPLVVKAVKLAGVSDLVISNADAARLRDPQGNVGYLAEGRVIIVAAE